MVGYFVLERHYEYTKYTEYSKQYYSTTVGTHGNLSVIMR